MAEAVAAIDSEPIRARYLIVRGADMHDLAVAVNKRMGDGWTPIGGVIYVPPDPMSMAAAASRGGTLLPYWQAMIRD